MILEGKPADLFFGGFVITLPAEMFGVTDFWLETRAIIKIFKKMIAGMKTKVVCIGKHKKNIFFWKKKFKMADLKKALFPTPPILKIFL